MHSLDFLPRYRQAHTTQVLFHADHFKVVSCECARVGTGQNLLGLVPCWSFLFELLYGWMLY